METRYYTQAGMKRLELSDVEPQLLYNHECQAHELRPDDQFNWKGTVWIIDEISCTERSEATSYSVQAHQAYRSKR